MPKGKKRGGNRMRAASRVPKPQRPSEYLYAKEEGASTQGGNPAPFELEIAEALEKIGLRTAVIKTTRHGHSGLAIPHYAIDACPLKKGAI